MRVVKQDADGAAVLHYDGDVVAQGETWVCVRAVFGHGPAEIRRGDMVLATLENGDVFTEWFYTDRWYNVFRIAAADGRLRGWYCNITRPAHIDTEGQTVRSDDLALDVFVTPRGVLHTLDVDEFEALGLPATERAHAWAAMERIRALVGASSPPFDLD